MQETEPMKNPKEDLINKAINHYRGKENNGAVLALEELLEVVKMHNDVSLTVEQKALLVAGGISEEDLSLHFPDPFAIKAQVADPDDPEFGKPKN